MGTREMVLTKDVWLPSEEELTVEEVPLGTASLRAGAMHLGKFCEVQNNEFMLCRTETGDPRACIKEGKEVTSCSLNFFRQVKATCAAEFMTYASCLEKNSASMDFWECRKTQAIFDGCIKENLGMDRPHWGYHSLPKIHDTDRPLPVEEKPAWMDNPKAKKLGELPKDFPRTYKSWGAPGLTNQNCGEV